MRDPIYEYERMYDRAVNESEVQSQHGPGDPEDDESDEDWDEDEDEEENRVIRFYRRLKDQVLK